MKILFAHPTDVAAADQAAAGLVGVTVRLRAVVTVGRMYVVPEGRATAIRYGFELEQQADEVIVVPGATG